MAAPTLKTFSIQFFRHFKLSVFNFWDLIMPICFFFIFKRHLGIVAGFLKNSLAVSGVKIYFFLKKKKKTKQKLGLDLFWCHYRIEKYDKTAAVLEASTASVVVFASSSNCEAAP